MIHLAGWVDGGSFYQPPAPGLSLGQTLLQSNDTLIIVLRVWLLILLLLCYCYSVLLFCMLGIDTLIIVLRDYVVCLHDCDCNFDKLYRAC